MNFFLTLFFSLFISSTPSVAEELHFNERQQLKIMLADIEQGINSGKIELMTKYIDDQATVTWLNAEVSIGPAEVRDYFKRMVGDSKDAVLSKYETHPKIDQATRFYGDIAIASGTTEDLFTPHHRSPFKFDTRWTATLLNKNGEWRIISLTLTTNTFNNALISELERFTVLSGAGGFIAGLLLCLFWVSARWFWRQKRVC